MSKGVEDRIRALIVQILDSSDDVRSVPVGDSWFLPELLDSLELMGLLSLIETEWEFQFTDDELVPEVFESIASLSRAVLDKI